MIPPRAFKKHGCDTASLKPIFSKHYDEMSDGQQRLIDLLESRIQDGITKNLRDSKFFHAIDVAYDAPYKQITPTLVKDIATSPDMSYEKAMAAFQKWGIETDGITCEQKLPGGKVVKTVNAPTFYDVLVPIVRTYVGIRVAKLFNERNLVPLFEYKPSTHTKENRVKCAIVTDIGKNISHNMGYAAILRDAIFKAVLYGKMLMFPRDVWWTQKGIRYIPLTEEEKQLAFNALADDMVEKGEDPTTNPPQPPEDREVRYVEREGLRYIQPPPTRFFYDLHHGLPTFNSNTGCEYAGYWSVTRWGEIDRNPEYWTKEKISFGQNWYNHQWAGNYFDHVYPCNISFPTVTSGNESDREERATWYTDDDADAACFLAVIWMKIVPKEYDLGTLDEPVWFRFDMAGERSVVWASPVPYNAVLYAGYDADEMRDRNPGLGLELLPFQDHVQNILSTIILTTKQNLANVNFYDTSVIDGDVIKELENSQEKMLRGMNFVPYDTLKLQKMGRTVNDAFQSVTFTKGSVQELTGTLWTVIGVMERVLQFSAQEVGAAASHQQSASEMRLISSTSSNKSQFTGSFIDNFMDAWMKQIFEAYIAFGDEEILAEVSNNIPDISEVLEGMGINEVERVEDRDSVVVQLNKAAITMRYASFAARHNMAMRGVDREMAVTMMQTLQMVANNQLLIEHVGPEPLIKLLELATKLAGAPQDFELETSMSARAMQNLKAMQQQLNDMAGQITQSAVEASAQNSQAQIDKFAEGVNEQVTAPVEAELKQQEQISLKNAEEIERLKGQIDSVLQIISSFGSNVGN